MSGETHHRKKISECSTPFCQSDTSVLEKLDDLYTLVCEDTLSAEALFSLPSFQEFLCPEISKGKLQKTKAQFYFNLVYVGFCALVCGTIFLSLTVYISPGIFEASLSAWFKYYDMEIDKEPCLVDSYEFFHDVFRPPVNCNICHNINRVDRVTDITHVQFEMKYAYSGRPVVIADGTRNWTATKSFCFDFFKNIYPENSPVLTNVEKNCQFFDYKNNFNSLGDVFSMSPERANMQNGTDPWYIGWSNCDSSAANILRQHYSRPYFLPKSAESSRTDWIFMGSPGYGANMHIDNVGNPSWQAQITGTKLWILRPPLECAWECKREINVTVHPGDIFVLDTNMWYHATVILGEEMSITIGSEYD